MAELRKMKINLGDDLQTNYGHVKRDSVQSSIHAGPQAIEEYEVQYDPNNDFAIFGIGDPTRGGIQTMKEKMNLADGVKEADSSSDEDDHSVRRKDSKLSTKVNSGSNGLTG